MKTFDTLIKKYSKGNTLFIVGPNMEELGIESGMFLGLSIFDNEIRKSNLHGKFDSIFMMDPELSKRNNNETIIAELIRFLKKDGVIILHLKKTYHSSVWGMKAFIMTRSFDNPKLLSQDVISQNESIVEISLKRQIKSNKNWSIGIPSNGLRNPSILKLIKSIYEARNYIRLKKGVNIEIDIMLIGEKDKLFKVYPIRYFQQSLPKNLNALGEKKFIITTNAAYENILIIHDRYVLDESFFIGFEEWGYDFEFCTVQQYDLEGNVFDPILTLEETGRFDRQMYRVKDQSYPYKHLYISGGLIIIKKMVTDYVNFDPFLLQNESEDIDFAFRAGVHGITAQFNSISIARTFTPLETSNIAVVPFVPVNNGLMTLFRFRRW